MKWKAMSDDINANKYEVNILLKYLKPGSPYQCRVRAHNLYGWGIYSDHFRFHTRIAVATPDTSPGGPAMGIPGQLITFGCKTEGSRIVYTVDKPLPKPLPRAVVAQVLQKTPSTDSSGVMQYRRPFRLENLGAGEHTLRVMALRPLVAKGNDLDYSPVRTITFQKAGVAHSVSRLQECNNRSRSIQSLTVV
jgi:hypothetical protein